MKFLPHKNPMISGSRSDLFSIMRDVMFFVAFFYAATFIAYLFLVLFPLDFLYGYYRYDLLPGPFVDDRYSLFWVFAMLGNFRILVPLALIWTFSDITSFFRRDITFILLRIVFILDLLILIVQFIFWCGFCNNPNFRNATCDADLSLYCKVNWKSQPDVCPPGEDPPSLVQSDLPFNASFTYWWRFTVAYLIWDFLLCLSMIKIVLYMLRILSRNGGSETTESVKPKYKRIKYSTRDDNSEDERENGYGETTRKQSKHDLGDKFKRYKKARTQGDETAKQKKCLLTLMNPVIINHHKNKLPNKRVRQ